MQMRSVAVAAVVAVGVMLLGSACEKPDASLETSPSVRTLLGTTTGNRIMSPPGQPPAPKDPPANWQESLALATWTELENGIPALQVVLEVKSHEGAGMDIWLTKDSGEPVVEWSGGHTETYGGTVCFQFSTQQDGQALPLDPASGYRLTVAFIDIASGDVISSRQAKITNETPKLTGSAPQQGSKVFSEVYACRRGN